MTRTRLAPSPTGYLHIGNLRTALYSFLLAKQSKGTFFLRVEDTDRERHVLDATERLLKTLAWAGINPDEGVVLENGMLSQKGNFQPYIQSERLPIYHEHTTRLLESDHAYRCFCTRERLEAMRKEQETRQQAPMYDGLCRSISKEESEQRSKSEPHVVRFRIPRGETVTTHDLIRGDVFFKAATLDDQVILKSDGFPTYHLAHVVDDHLMETTHVIRGEEWLPSLPKHLLLFRAFGWEPPLYAHVPLLLAKGGGKLSKRDGDVSVETFIEKGYLPEAMVNFIALLGWNPGTSRPPAADSGTGQRPRKEEEIFTMDQLTDRFSLERVQKAGAIFDVTKLDWLQGQWMRKFPLEEFVRRIRPIVEKALPEAKSDAAFARKAALIQERITFFSEAPDMLSYFYDEPTFASVATAGKPTVTTDLLANPKQKITKEDLPKIIDLLKTTLEGVDENNWNEAVLKEKLEAAAIQNNLKKGQLLWPLRAALTGREYSPGAFEVAGVLGREKTLERLRSTPSPCTLPPHSSP